MKIKELNWQRIILTSVGVAIGINALILLLMLLFFYFEIFSVMQVLAIENYFIFFILFSPLIASLVSCGIVSFFTTQKKLLHTIFSTILTFSMTVLILANFTLYVGSQLYLNFDHRVNPCYYKTCGE